MAFDAAQAARQAISSLRNLTLRQQLTLVVAALLVTGTLGLFVYLAGREEFKTLYTDLSPEEAPRLVQDLASRGIAAELSSEGTTVSVPASDLAKARLDLAADGLPRSGRLGFEIFDKPNWAGSDFVEQVNYQRALEGELERTIEDISGVEAARVHLALAKQALFTEQHHDSKAAVLLKLHPGARLSDEDLGAITFLVANSVDNMKPEDVRVVDAHGHVPLLSHGGEVQEEGTHQLEARLTQKLIDTLTPLVGVNEVRASVTVEDENGSNEVTEEAYNTNDSVVLSSQTTSEEGEAAIAQGVPGSTSNVPQDKAQQPPAAANPAASPKSAATAASTASVASASPEPGLINDTKTFGVGKTIRHSVAPGGSIRRMSAAVLVDDATETVVENKKSIQKQRKRTPDELKQIEALAAAAIGINPARGDKLVVENMSFAAAEQLQPPTLVQRLPSLLNQWTSVLRYVGLAVALMFAYLLILRPLKRQLSASLSSLGRLPAGAPLQHALAVGGSSAGAAGASPVPFQPALPEVPTASQIAALKETVTQRVVSEPVYTSRVIQEWIRQH